jgi:hypothetical protein
MSVADLLVRRLTSGDLVTEASVVELQAVSSGEGYLWLTECPLPRWGSARLIL